METPTQINLASKKIFDAVLKKLDSGGCAKIGGDQHGIMPLTVERISDEMKTPWGTGKIYSFCHYYEQNGDQMQDPEVTFLVVDNRAVLLAGNFKDKEKYTYDFFGVWPMSFSQANMGIYQEAMKINGSGGCSFANSQQKDITVFCNDWMQNIWHQNLQHLKDEQPCSTPTK